MPVPIKDYLATPEKKRTYNRSMFDIIAPEYDRITRLLSFWNDRRWKRLLIKNLMSISNPSAIDFACGTGDITELLSQKYPAGHIIGADLSPLMLALARTRLQNAKNIGFARIDMSTSSFHSDIADIITGGYALRNAPDLSRFISEVYRILRPGGTAAFLDFSHPAPSLYATFQYYILLWWGSFWGEILHRNSAVYGYIAESLKVFPDRTTLELLICDCGFVSVKTRLFFAGTIAIVTFCKPLSN